MTKNNSKNWLEIEEEAQKAFIKFMSENSDYLETPSAIDVINWWLNFFKPYFQEKMHEDAVEELECYCSDDRASGYYSNGHFSSCPQYPKAQKIITCHLCKRSYTKDLTVNNFTPLTQFCSECGQGFVDNNPKE